MAVLIKRGAVSLILGIDVVRRPLAQLNGGDDCFGCYEPPGPRNHKTSGEIRRRRAERSRVRQLASKVQPADKGKQLAQGDTISAEAAGQIRPTMGSEEISTTYAGEIRR